MASILLHQVRQQLQQHSNEGSTTTTQKLHKIMPSNAGSHQHLRFPFNFANSVGVPVSSTGLAGAFSSCSNLEALHGSC